MKKLSDLLLSINIKKYKKLVIILNCCLLLNACSEINFSSVPGYKTLFAKEEKIAIVKRRPVENLVTYNSGAIKQDPRLNLPEGYDPKNQFGYVQNSGKQNDYGYNKSYGQQTTPPYIKNDLHPGADPNNNRNVPDFRSPYAPLDPMRTEEKSLYEGRFMSQKDTGEAIPRGLTPEQYMERQRKIDEAESSGQIPIPMPALPSNPQSIRNPGTPGSALPQQNNFAEASPYNVPGPSIASTETNGRRQPVLNQQVRVQLLSQYSGTPVKEEYPNLATVPNKPNYGSIRESMSEAMQNMVDERNRIAEHKAQAAEPIGNPKVDENYNSALPPAAPSEEDRATAKVGTPEQLLSREAMAQGMAAPRDSEVETAAPVAPVGQQNIEAAPETQEAATDKILPNKVLPETAQTQTDKAFEVARMATKDEIPQSMQSEYPVSGETRELPPGGIMYAPSTPKQDSKIEDRPSEPSEIEEPLPERNTTDMPRSLLPNYPKPDYSERQDREAIEEMVRKPVEPQKPREPSLQEPIEIIRPSRLPVEDVRNVGIAEATPEPASEIQPFRPATKVLRPTPTDTIRTLPNSRYSGIRNGAETEKAKNPFVYRQ